MFLYVTYNVNTFFAQKKYKYMETLFSTLILTLYLKRPF